MFNATNPRAAAASSPSLLFLPCPHNTERVRGRLITFGEPLTYLQVRLVPSARHPSFSAVLRLAAEGGPQLGCRLDPAWWRRNCLSTNKLSSRRGGGRLHAVNIKFSSPWGEASAVAPPFPHARVLCLRGADRASWYLTRGGSGRGGERGRKREGMTCCGIYCKAGGWEAGGECGRSNEQGGWKERRITNGVIMGGKKGRV